MEFIKFYLFIWIIFYKKVTNHYSTPNSDSRLTPTPGNPVPNESQAQQAPTPAPATPTAETPATPAVTTTVAGTSKDNTYQAPAAKAEDKKELPNTGGKDNGLFVNCSGLNKS